MAGEFNKKPHTEAEPAQVPLNGRGSCRNLLCNSLLHSPPVLLTSQITGSPVYQPNGLGFMVSQGGSTPKKREKAGEIEQNVAQVIDSAGRFAVLIPAVLGAERPDTGTIMMTMMQMAQRTSFFTELVRAAGKLAHRGGQGSRPGRNDAAPVARKCHSKSGDRLRETESPMASEHDE